MSDVEMPDVGQLDELMTKRQFDEWMGILIRGILTLAGGREMERQLVNFWQQSRPGVPSVRVPANQSAIAILEDPKNTAMVHVYQNNRCRELQAILLGTSMSASCRIRLCKYIEGVVNEHCLMTMSLQSAP